ncbi:hypothetical protein HOG07_03185 [Candidatus Woesearchaeota archaeon]|jgi:hypothetical protein|nr:hypothetical protein [Candidatus Woesearchaeota archaeon]MBT4336390.1 hypothetical protein [Candidatus Woesearchaeota archaeon]MBT4469955.1 hypothetical protein [Candidatus Woesearchaeota archaeon]MBT6744321.1 hypothetical protein [Candidatus Woesearchaeota archaeon]
MSNLEYHLGEKNFCHELLGNNRFLVTLGHKNDLFLYLRNDIPKDCLINNQMVVGGGKYFVAVSRSWSFEGPQPRQVEDQNCFIHFYSANETFGPVPVDVADTFADLIAQELKGRNVTRKVIRPNVSNGLYNPLWEELGFDQETQKRKMFESLNGVSKD